MLRVTNKGLSIRSKITIYAVILTVTALALISAISYTLFRTQLKQSIAKHQAAEIASLAFQVDDQLKHVLNELKEIADSIGPGELSDPNRLQRLLDGRIEARNFYDNGFMVIGADYRLVIDSPFVAKRRGKNYSFREFAIQTLKTGRPYIADPYLPDVPPHDPNITFTAPIKGPTGKVIGLLAGRHNLLKDSFLQSIVQNTVSDIGYQYIITANRTVVVHPDKSRIMEMVKPGVNAAIDRAIQEGFEGSLENVNSKGVPGITSLKHLKSANWIIASHVPISSIYKPLRSIEKTIMMAFVGIAFLAVLLIWSVLGKIMSPLQTVIDQIGSIHTKTGDERLLPDVFDGDLGRLSSAFNAIVATFDSQKEAMLLMQTEMQQQKVFVEGVLNKAAVPIFVLDSNHRIIIWNDAIEDLTGLKAEEMIGTNRQWFPFYESERPVLADLVLSTDESHLEELYGDYRMSQHVLGGLQAEGWLENVGGQRRYLLYDAAPVFDANDVKLGVIETLLDITGRKEAEDEQRKLSWAVENNPSSIVITDPAGTIEYVNSKFCEVTGYTAQEAVGQNPRVLKSGEMPKEKYAELWQTISNGRTWRGEFHNKKMDGELYWELASISPIMDEDNKITHYLAVKEDITQRKQVEAELAKSREELQRKHDELRELFAQVEIGKREWEDTMDSLSEMVLICDPFGVVNQCNRAVLTFTGLPYNEIIDVECMELFARVGFEITSYDGTSGQLAFDDDRRHFEFLSNELKQIGTDQIRGVVVTIHETTELFKMNEKLQKAYAELQQTQAQIFQQEKMASIGQLAAGVAHEINNPMGFISSNLTTMGKYMEKINAFEAALIEAVQDKGDTETVAALGELRKKMKIDFILGDIRSLLEESRDGAERVRRIVQDLKSFSHVDEAECKAISINDSLDTTLNMLRNEIKYVADIEQEYDPDLPMLLCFPQQINQVFMNVLVNAAHAMEGHGVIRITTLRESDDIVVRISDTGKGIAPENLNRIFEPFFTTKEVGKGTGLGLSISYDIIKKHGGGMNVESEVGVGTTFVIRLPLDHQFVEVEGVS